MGENKKRALRVEFDRNVKLESHSAKISSDAGLMNLNGSWIEHANSRRQMQKLIPDMDSSESPTHGQQEGSVYNGHFRRDLLPPSVLLQPVRQLPSPPCPAPQDQTLVL